MAILHSKCISLILSSPDQKHRSELRDKAHWHVKLHEQKQVQKVRLILKAKRLDDALVPQCKCEARKHDNQRDARHCDLLEHVLMDHMTQLMIDDSTDFFHWMLCDQSIEKHDFTEIPEARNEGV